MLKLEINSQVDLLVQALLCHRTLLLLRSFYYRMDILSLISLSLNIQLLSLIVVAL